MQYGNMSVERLKQVVEGQKYWAERENLSCFPIENRRINNQTAFKRIPKLKEILKCFNCHEYFKREDGWAGHKYNLCPECNERRKENKDIK